MRLSCITILSLVLSSTYLFAQSGWYKIPCPDQMGSSNSDAQFFSDDVGFFTFLSYKVNPHEVLFKTFNGGNNWQNISLPSGATSPSHCFLNNHVFYFEGSESDSLIMYFTKDTRNTWSHLPLVTGCFGGISFVSEAIGYICGDGKGFNK